MKAIDLVMRSLIPPDIDLTDIKYDKKGLSRIAAELAQKHPDKYRAIMKKIMDLGRESSYIQGETLTLSDLKPTFDKGAVIRQMQQEVEEMKKSTPVAKRKEARLDIYAKYSDLLTKLTAKSVTGNTGHNLGNSILSGARGNPNQLKAMVTTPAVYTDFRDKPIDMFIHNSFGEGLRPAEYLASSFGTRKGVISTKESTADAGDLAKQMVQAATRVVITQEDCGTSNGILMSADEPEELRGRVLQRNYGTLPAGDVFDKGSFKALKTSGVKQVMVRSPLTCTAKEGICQKCAGLDMDGRFPPIGSASGITAAQALGEPLTQGALNTKHGGGALGQQRVSAAGFKVINQIMQSPSNYPNKAAVAQVSGKVEKVEDAPQGGKFITIGGQRHYSLPDFELYVKEGDEVEHGDVLGEGILDIKDVLRTRGIGSGRQHYVNYLKHVFDNSGIYANRRNLEIVARGALDHVRITGNDTVGSFLPDDLASYNRLMHSYTPEPDSRAVTPEEAVGKYLQNPALHYSIGTKITPRMSKNLREAKFGKVVVSDIEPHFEAEMERLRTATRHDQDWMASLHSSYQASRLSNAAVSGYEAELGSNVHFAPRLAIGQGFGDNMARTGKY
jgi:DNA-directed RNA polymerase subunit beta'